MKTTEYKILGGTTAQKRADLPTAQKCAEAYTPDYDFMSNDGVHTPVLVGNYFWTGAYIYYFPDVSNLDVPTYGYQVKNNESWSFTSRDNWLHADQATLQAAFISAVQNGQTWEPLTDRSKFCTPVIQHGKVNLWVEVVPTNYNTVSSISVSPTTSSATVGSSYSQLFTSTCYEADDGSYSYVWTATGATGGLSLDNAAIASPTLSGVPTASGSVYLDVIVTDSYGNKANAEVSLVIADAAPVYNHVSSVTVTPIETDYTSGDSMNQVFTANPSPVDDGSYSYYWHWSKSSAGTLTPSADGKTCTLTGTAPATAGTYIVMCDVTDSYNHTVYSTSAYGKVVVSAPAKAILTSAAFSPKTASFTQNSDVGTYTNTIVCDAPDDGSYTYAAPKLSGNAAAGLTATISGSTVTITGTPTTAGTAYCDVTVTDSYATKRGAELAITINAATPTGINISGDTATIHAGNQSTYTTHGKPYSRNWWVTMANASGGSVTDDGTLTYLWYWIDNTTGTGLVFDPDDAANIMIDGTPTKAGQAHMQCDITDVYGTTITAPSQGISIS